MNKRIKTLQTQLNAHLKKESVDNTLKDRDFPTFGSTTCPFLAVKKKKNDHSMVHIGSSSSFFSSAPSLSPTNNANQCGPDLPVATPTSDHRQPPTPCQLRSAATNVMPTLVGSFDASPCSTNAPATSSEGSANSSITVDNTTGRRWNPNFSPSATHGFVS
jgi:hypothetical protein